MSFAVYAFTTASKTQDKISANELNWTGTWSSSGSYSAATFATVLYGDTKYIAVTDNLGVNPTVKLPNKQPNPFSQLVIVQTGDEPPFAPPTPADLPVLALETAWAGTALAYHALTTAWVGTATANTGTNEAAAAIGLANAAFVLAAAGTDTTLSYAALQTAWSGTSGANSALDRASTGTNEAAAAIALANQALTVAFVGTSSGNAPVAYTALQTAWSGTSGANSALARASTGTNEASAAVDLANQALTVAFLGTIHPGDTALAYTALQTAWSGTSGANSALDRASTGTNEAAAAIVLANQALQVAFDGTAHPGDTALAYTALQTAWSGTSGANSALDRASTGTLEAAAGIVLANQALVTAYTGTSQAALALSMVMSGTDAAAAIALAYTALQMAWSGTSGANSGISIAVQGTNEAAAAIVLANQALQTAWTGTAASSSALAYSALQTAWSGTSGANSAISIAVQGTNEAAAAIVLANQALTTAWVGTSASGQTFSTGTVPYASAISGTISYDFAGSDYLETTVSGNLWVSAQNLSAGLERVVVLKPDGVSHTVGYSAFKWFGTSPPVSILDKEIMLSFACFDTTIANTRAASVAQY